MAAHPAYTDPMPDDNVYSQDMSIMMTLDWEDGSFVVGRWIIGGPGGVSHHDWAWSLTKTHEKLVAYVGRNRK